MLSRTFLTFGVLSAFACAFTIAACQTARPALSPSSTPNLAESPASQTPATPPQAIEPLRPLVVERAYPQLSFRRPVELEFADDGTGRMFIVTQAGQIFVGSSDEANSVPAALFLDIQDRVGDEGNEEGLLGMALDPGFGQNGLLYLYYTLGSPQPARLSRFNLSSTNPNQANPGSELVLLEVPQPFQNHNGGALAFGRDGHLYLGLGDGGSGGDPQGNGQKLTTTLGKILRLDVSNPASGSYQILADNPFVGRSDARGEIWAYGLRNPWRFSFDRQTGQLWAGDVGQNAWEEIDLIQKGANYGWNIMEANYCYPTNRATCDTNGLIRPVTEYENGAGNCSVTGGYVYRGRRLASLFGAYVYADYCSGRIWGLRYDGVQITEQMQLVDTTLQIPSFAEDLDGELLILAFDGRIYRLREP